jgi:putative ABC transport system permease protein
MINDLRYALRQLLKNPGFTAVATLCLALGIGANTAIFSVINAVLLRPLPYKDPDRLVILWMRFTGIGIPKDQNGVSAPEFMDLRRMSQSFSHLAAMSNASFNMKIGEAPDRFAGWVVSSSMFPLLGTPAYLGRTFLPEEEQLGRENVALLSYGLWQRRFGADRGVVGKNYDINGRSAQIVGVMPPGFNFPDEAEMWMPLSFTADQLSARGRHGLTVVARIRKDLSFAQARSDMEGVSRRIVEGAPDYPYERFGFRVLMNPLLEEVVGDMRTALLLLMGAVVFVLLIACANVASLLVARATVREREFAVRTAVGAGRARLLKQLLTESILLSVLGAAVGVLLAIWGLSRLTAASTQALPRMAEIQLDTSVLTFTVLVAVGTGILFGLLPALQATKRVTHDVLKEGGRSGVASGARHFLRNSLVVGQVALSLILLISAGLLIMSFVKLQDVDPGFKSERILTMRISLPSATYSEPEKVRTFFRNLRERVLNLPGVNTAGLISVLPLSGQNSSGTVTVDTQAVPSDETTPEADQRFVTPGFFETLEIQLLSGRTFEERDTESSAPVAIVDESMAKTYWPGDSALGKRIKRGGRQSPTPWTTIVGIVRHVRYRTLESPSRVEVYWPHAQSPTSNMSLAVRASNDPRGLIEVIRKEVTLLDPLQPVYSIRTMEEIWANSMARRRTTMLLLATFAAVALLLAAVGIYGVLAYSVSQRKQEIGIRMALGARRADVLRLVVGQGMTLALIGVGIGLFSALALVRFLSGLLYQVTSTDPATFAGVSLLLAVVALLACYLPARRAAKVDPMVALRYE